MYSGCLYIRHTALLHKYSPAIHMYIVLSCICMYDTYICNMCLCVYYVYASICVFTYVCIRIRMCMYVCTYVCVRMYVHTYVYVPHIMVLPT